jgi:hypothetical protein
MIGALAFGFMRGHLSNVAREAMFMYGSCVLALAIEVEAHGSPASSCDTLEYGD